MTDMLKNAAMAFALSLSVMTGFADERVALDWMLDKGCRIDGDILSVEVSAKGGTALARAKIDLSEYEGRGVEAVIQCRGSDVEKPTQGWLGTKFMLHYMDVGGIDKWPGAPQVSGTFDWREFRLRDMLASDTKTGSAELVLGLQKAAGKIEFDLSTLRIAEADFSWLTGHGNQDGKCAYAAPRCQPRRGVMSPGRDMTKDDFETLERWGVNLLRFQIKRTWAKENDNRDIGEFDRWLDGQLDHLDKFVLPQVWERGIAVVVDLHVVPGGRSASSEMNMFHEKDYADHFVACWERIARRFKGRPGIYGYDLVNEPMQREPGPEETGWWTLQENAARAIRRIDSDVCIIVEANEGDSPEAFSYMRTLDLTNVIYETHMYLPMAFTHQRVFNSVDAPVAYPNVERGWNRDFLRQQLKPVRDFQLKYGARIYAGEFSAVAWAPGAENYLRDCIALFEEYGWDWTYHAFRESPVWDVEMEGVKHPGMAPASSDTPRKRALLDGLRSNSRDSW